MAAFAQSLWNRGQILLRNPKFQFMRCNARTTITGWLLSGLLVVAGLGVVRGGPIVSIGQVTLSWEPATEPGVTGYKLYYGTESRSYSELLDVGSVPVAQLSGLSDGTTYYCSVTAYNSAGLEGGFSEEIQFTYASSVGDRVEISGQSGSQAVGIGKSTVLEVSAIGGGPVSYQWLKDGVAIPGATDSSLVFDEVKVGDTGRYSVLVARGDAVSTSSSAMLVAALDAPRIKVFDRMEGEGGEQLVRLDLDGGLETNIHVFASGDLDDWEVVYSHYNETGSVTFSDPGSANAGQRFYRVAAAADVPVISNPPRSRVIDLGGSTTLSVAATAQGEVSYQWLKNGVAIPGATGSSLALTGLRAADGGSYSVAVSSGTATTTTEPTIVVAALPAPKIRSLQRLKQGDEPLVRLGIDAAVGSNIHVFVSEDLESWEWLASQRNQTGTIEVSDPGAATSPRRFYRVAASGDGVVIDRAPRSEAVPIGGGTILSVRATGNSGLSYQWRKDGVEIPGATSAFLELTDVQNAEGGRYSVVVTSGTATTVSEPAVVVPAIEAPRITSMQRLADEGGGLVRFDLDGAEGNNIHVFASADLEIWEWLGSQVNATGTIEVSDPDAATSPRRFYRVAASSDKPVINRAPQSQAVLIGGSTTLSVDASADGALSYQWFKDGVEIPGATGASLELTDLQATDGGRYTVVVSSLSGSTATEPITLVAAVEAPRITSLLRFSYAGEHFVRLGLDGAPGATIHLFASGDLEHWEWLSAHPNQNGSIVASDPQSVSSAPRFYRVAASGGAGDPSGGK